MNFYLITALGIGFLFLMTTLGSAFVYFFNKQSIKLNTIVMGLSAGIMFSASIWSLLLPAIEQGKDALNMTIITLGFAFGGIFLYVLDLIIKKIKKEEPNSIYSRPRNLFIAVTLHNIPEGLCVGFAFGSALAVMQKSYLTAAIILAIGIGLQNFPEGVATTLPIQQVIGNKHKSFLLGVASGAVEVIAGIIGVLLASKLIILMPFLLSFSAGAMIYVTASELMPECNSKLGTWAFMIGFIFMTLCDVLLG